MKRIPRLSWLAALLPLALAAGCARQQVKPEKAVSAEYQQLKSYYPLAVGNKWTYAGTFVGQKAERTIEIVKQEGNVFIDNAGGRLRLDREGLRDDQRYLIRLPLKEGQKWMSVPSPVSVERYEIERLGFTEQVQAGVFQNCLRVKAINHAQPGQTLINMTTFAPGAGIILLETKMVVEGKGEIPQVRVELKSYSVSAAKPPAAGSD